MSNLERVTVLVVEDSRQVRNIVISILRQVGVGNILRASDGAEAVNILRDIRNNPGKVGASEIDLIIADWHMEPVDGGTLLRWVRRHKESPDKMMPFFVLTGDCDEDMVVTARDLGVSEFIGKPFRIDQFISHIEGAVKDDRRFVSAPGYFGPDRRRKVEPVEDDQRGTSTDKAKFFEAPRRLFSKSGGSLNVSPEEIESAVSEVESMQSEFSDWITKDFESLEEIYVKAKASDSEEERTALVKSMAPICHELRGQGGLFGYMLISVVADSLHQISRSILGVPNDALKLLKTHLDLMKAIIREDIQGDGGALGPELMSSLQFANASFVEKKENELLVTRDFVLKARQGSVMFGAAARQMAAEAALAAKTTKAAATAS